MTGLSEALRAGTWLTRERVRLVAFALLAAFVLGAGYLIATSDGLNDSYGRPLGTDFSNVYAAGSYVLEGAPSAPFDPARQYARERAIFGQGTQFYGWHYPPFFLGVAALLALMPYGLALLVWQGVTLAFYLWAIRAILAASLPSPLWEGSRAESARGDAVTTTIPLPAPSAPTSPTKGKVIRRDWLLLAVAFPAVFINLGQGHNGFLTAALFALALTSLATRPILAGVLFGCLAYKPQFALLVPIALIASGNWRAFAAAAAMVALSAAAATLAFGMEVWTAFLASTEFTRSVVLEQGGTGWHKIQSVFSWTRMWGGGVALAYALQAAVMLTLAAAIAWLWRSPAAYPRKAAALLIGSVLATPYSLDYDLMLLAPAIAYLAADGMTRGFAAWEKTMLAALWIVPLVARSLPQATLVPLAVPLMLAAFAMLLRRAMNESGAAGLWHLAARPLQ